MQYPGGDAVPSTWLSVWNRSECQGRRLGSISAVATTVLGERPVAVTGAEDVCHVWDLADGGCLGEISAGAVEDLAVISLMGRPIVVVKDRHPQPAALWDVATGRHLGDLPDEEAEAVATVMIGGRPVAVTGHWDMTVRLWDLSTCRQLGRPLAGHHGTVRRVTTALVRGRPYAVTGTVMDVDQSWDTHVRVWDLAEGKQVGALPAATDSPVSAMAVTELDGRAVLATGNWDGTIGVWDLVLGQRLRTWRARSLLGTPLVSALTVAEFPGRTALVTGHSDGSVRTWDAHTGEQMGRTLRLHPAGTTPTAHLSSPGDRGVVLASSPGDRVVICSDSEVAVALRSFTDDEQAPAWHNSFR